MQNEIWKDISGFNGAYKISNKGRVKSLKSKKVEKILKQKIQSNGRYYYVSLSHNGFTKNFRIHRLVAEAFIPNPDNKPQVNHKNCDVFDNSVHNLEWVTASENLKHAYENGRNAPPLNFLGKFGSQHNKSKGFYLKTPDGSIEHYGSGLELKRKLGADNTSITMARRKIQELGSNEYVFKKGKLNGYTFLPRFELV